MFNIVVKDVPAGLKAATRIPATQAINNLLAARRIALQCHSGEFVPTGLVASILSRLQFTGSYAEAMEKIISVRNTAYFTAFVLKRFTELSRSTAQEKPDVVANMTIGLLSSFKQQKPEISRGVDRELATDLITLPFLGQQDFMAVTPRATQLSYIMDFSSLYENAVKHKPGNDEYTKPYTMAAMGRVRVVDWLFTLRHSPGLWASFFPADRTGAAGVMTARRHSCELLAAFLHALTQVEILFVAGAVKESEKVMEKWLGTLPRTHAPGYDPFTEYIVPADVLNALDEGARYVQSLQRQPDGIAGEIFALPSDVAAIPKWSDAVIEAETKARAAVAAMSRIQYLKQLSEPVVAPIVSTAPLAAMPELRLLDQLIALGELFDSTTKGFAAAIKITTTEFMQRDIAAAVRAMPRPTLPTLIYDTDWYGKVKAGVEVGLVNGNLQLGSNKPQVTGVTEDIILRDFLMTFKAAGDVTKTLQAHVGINRTVAARIGKFVADGRWRSLYPGYLTQGRGRRMNRNQLMQRTSMLELLASLTGRNWYMVQQDLAHGSYAQAVASAMSSFLMIAKLKPGAPAPELADDADYDRTRGVANISREDLIIIRPDGAPYGLSDRAWLSLFQGKEAVVLVEGYMYAFLIDGVVAPSSELQATYMGGDMYYHYFSGNPTAAEEKRPGTAKRARKKLDESRLEGDVSPFITLADLPVDSKGRAVVPFIGGGGATEALVPYVFAEDEAMLHYAMFPMPAAPSRETIVFDLTSVYTIETVVGAITTNATLPTTNEGAEPLMVEELQWQGARDAAMTVVYGNGGEIAPTAGGGGDPDTAEATLRTNRTLDTIKERVKKASAHDAQRAADTTETVVQATATEVAKGVGGARNKGGKPGGRDGEDRKDTK